jgi:flagellar protein FliS
MEKEQIKDFTRRLSQCNRGGLIVIMYDIYFAYADEAQKAYEQKNHEDYKTAIHRAQTALTRLMGALDFSYPISKNLYALYMYARNMLSRALYENSTDGIREANRILSRLYDAFTEAAKGDDSAPLMSNTQQVYAGITYGRSMLNEDFMENDQGRGFLV